MHCRDTGEPLARLILALILLCTARGSQASNPQAEQNKFVDSCTARFTASDFWLDLRPLDSVAQTGQPRFKEFAEIDMHQAAYRLSYNPCSGFRCGLSQQAAAVCASDVFGGASKVDLGGQGNSTIVIEEDSRVGAVVAVITYRSGVNAIDENVLHTRVVLVCSEAEKGAIANATFAAESRLLQFELVSRHACLRRLGGQLGWSVGDFLLLIFFGSLFAYLMVAVLVNWLCRQRSGLDLLPHKDMCTRLVLLIRDGFAFTFCVLCRGHRDYSYVPHTEI